MILKGMSQIDRFYITMYCLKLFCPIRCRPLHMSALNLTPLLFERHLDVGQTDWGSDRLMTFCLETNLDEETDERMEQGTSECDKDYNSTKDMQMSGNILKNLIKVLYFILFLFADQN